MSKAANNPQRKSLLSQDFGLRMGEILPLKKTRLNFTGSLDEAKSIYTNRSRISALM